VKNVDTHGSLGLQPQPLVRFVNVGNGMITTIKISKNDLAVWKSWCRHYNLTSENMMSELIRRVKLHKQAELFNSLPFPNRIKKPLSGIKIEVCKKSIQKTVAA
jgi:hypothetical protein